MKKIVFVCALAVVIGPACGSFVFAQTVGYADAVGAMAVACKTDIDKYCKKVDLGGGRIGKCLTANATGVSAACKSTVSVFTELVRKRKAAQASIMQVCDVDIRRLCQGIAPGDGNLLQCFFDARRNVSPKCRQVVADAGYEVTIAPSQDTDQVNLDPDNIVGGLQHVDAFAHTLTAASLRQMAVNGMNDPSRAQRLNRPPLVPQLNSLAQLTIAIQFDLNSARIRPDSFRAVGLMADALDHPLLTGYRFIVIGNTDATGSREHNLKLSQARADAIRDALIRPFGIDPGRLQAVGLGEEDLLYPDRPTDPKNRRVQLINIGR
jgi:outer membrane protein OmpA-like peptidoglycan-associated protein